MHTDRYTSSSGRTRCVFAHDHIFLEHEGRFASRSSFPASVLERYADAFGEVDVICRSRYEAQTTVPPITDARIRFHPMLNVRRLGGLHRLGHVQAKIAAVVAQADCVIARLPSTIGLLAAAAAFRQKKPLAVEVVGNALEANLHHGALMGIVVGPIEHFLCKTVVRHAPAVIYITTNYLQSIYPTNGRAFVCPNVHIEDVATATEPRIDNLAVKHWTLGLVGSLDVSYKGHDIAIAALAKLKEKLPGIDVRLEFAGGGAPERWRRLAAAAGVMDKVDFRGVIPPGPAMRAWYDKIDISIQPSQVEAQGRSIIEAMSRGRPVVASDVGGVPELIPSDCLVKATDAEGVADRVSELIMNPNRYADVANRNVEFSKTFLRSSIEQQRAKAFAFLRSQVGLAP